MKDIGDAAGKNLAHMRNREAPELLGGGASKRCLGMNLVEPVGGGLRDMLVKRSFGAEMVKREAVSDAGFASNIVSRNLAERPFGKQLSRGFQYALARRQNRRAFLSRECHST